MSEPAVIVLEIFGNYNKEDEQFEAVLRILGGIRFGSGETLKKAAIDLLRNLDEEDLEDYFIT